MFQLEVLTDGNVVLQERLTRALRTELNEIDGVEVEFATVEWPAAEKTKDVAIVGDAALWIFLSAATGASSKMVIETIRAWSAQRNQPVRITKGKQSIEIPRKPDEAQERLIDKFLDGEDR